MRCVRFLPLVFLVGIEGFVLFTPYVVTLLTVAYIARCLRTAPQPLPALLPA